MMLEKIYDKYDFDQDYEVYKYGQQVLIFNSIVNIFSILLSPGNDLKGIATIKPNKIPTDPKIAIMVFCFFDSICSLLFIKL